MKKKITVPHIIITIVLILMALLCLYPMWYTFICSISDRAYVEGGRVWFLPRGLNLASYQRILKDDTFFSSFFVSVKRVVVGCAINLLLLVLTAYPLCLPQRRFPAGKYLKWFFMANMLFPAE